MKNFKAFLLATLFALGGAAMAQDAASVEALIAEAEEARARAAAAEFEWRWTAKRIKQAKEALAAGDLEKARQLAMRAKREGDLAVEQAAIAETVWELALPK